MIMNDVIWFTVQECLDRFMLEERVSRLMCQQRGEQALAAHESMPGDVGMIFKLNLRFSRMKQMVGILTMYNVNLVAEITQSMG
jgi:hypothetical protein